MVGDMQGMGVGQGVGSKQLQVTVRSSLSCGGLCSDWEVLEAGLSTGGGLLHSGLKVMACSTCWSWCCSRASFMQALRASTRTESLTSAPVTGGS